ncbi:MAG: hypothetical protein PHX05_06155 [Acidobacteriota bacterium]|nr:hypothetical protein [Acidobacteriota bacterium]
MVSKNPLVQKIAGGGIGRELLQYLLDRHLAFTDEEYLESLVFVLSDPGAEKRAREMLGLIPPPVKLQYVQKRDADLKVADFILQEALDSGDAAILSLIIQNQGYPAEFLLRIAAQGGSAVLESMLENQVRLIAFPEIMERMEANPACNPYIRGRVKELRDFYLQPKAAEAIPETEIIEELATIAAEEKKKDPQLDVEQVKKDALTSLQRINLMGVSERVRLALTGNKTDRLVLIKDANKIVQAAVLDSPKMADDEVLIHVRNLSLPGEIIGKIANNREWTKNYTIVLALVENPKTPVNRALGFVKQLHDRDLKLLARDRNVSPVIRVLAQNLEKQKEKVK